MKTVLITGANRGLGLGFTRHYLEAGHRVYAAARNPAQCAAFRDLQKNFAERFNPLTLDVSNESSIAELPGALGSVQLDLVINNAGVCPDENLGGWSAQRFAATFSVNVTGPALVAQSLVPLMRKGSLLVNLSSGLGSIELNINPEEALDAYAASKAALNMLGRRLAVKLAPAAITVISISPGWVRTDMGGENADLSVEESVQDMCAGIEAATPEQSGLFFSREGELLPW